MHCLLPELGFNYNDCDGTGNISLPVGVQYPRVQKYKVKWQLQPSPARPLLAIHPECSGCGARHQKPRVILSCPCELDTVSGVYEATTATYGTQHHGIQGLEGTKTGCLVHNLAPAIKHHCHYTLVGEFTDLSNKISAGDAFVVV